MTNPKWTRLYVDSGAGIDKCQYYILSASVYWSIVKYKKDEWGRTVLDEMGQPVIDEEAKDLETRDVQLKTFLTIPVRTSDEYTQVVGPTQIVYNKDGTNAAYYNAPFVLYKNGEKIEARWMLSCKEYLDSGSDSESRDSRILNYYPSLDSETGKLTPKEMFLSDGKPLAVEAIVDGEVVWTQPILIIKNKYSSAMLNAWDGEMCIDQENGTIMSTMVGAGKKDVNNTFTGVLMGDVAAGAGFDERNHKGIGIYGFHQGAQSFGFNVDGTAFIGKAGRGRICMDGNKGTIASGAYEKYSAGMQIDLDGRDSYSASLFAYGSGGAFELNTDSNSALLEIRSTPDKDGNILFHIGKGEDKKFYIQSDNYNDSSKGTKIDLYKGTIDIKHDSGSFLKMEGDGSPYLQIHDGSSGKDILYAGTSKYQLESTNFVSGEKGIFIDLQKGEFEARKGIIGGWTINKDTLTAESIILNSNGSMSGGTTYHWSIETDGKASFSYITASEGGKIGPFTVNSNSLYIAPSGFKSASVYLGTDGISVGGSSFWADASGNVSIDGDLTVGGDTHFKTKGNVENGYIGSSGYTGGTTGGSWGFSPTGGHIGPWIIDEDSIRTDYSELGAGGTLKLQNSSQNGVEIFENYSHLHYGQNSIYTDSSSCKMTYGGLTNSATYVYIDSKQVQLHAGGNTFQIDSEGFLMTGTVNIKGWTGNVVFVDGSSLKFQNGILVGGQVADLVTMS